MLYRYARLALPGVNTSAHYLVPLVFNNSVNEFIITGAWCFSTIESPTDRSNYNTTIVMEIGILIVFAGWVDYRRCGPLDGDDLRRRSL